MEKSISIVINTYNRASTIGATLDSFKLLDYRNFEVIVVNGPSNDGTDAVLENYRGRIRIERCPVTNLSISRNIGIRSAAGEIVAFIDDDGVPEPEWLTRLVKAYDDQQVAGAGGFVYNHTGVNWQGQYMVSDRFGHSDSSATEPEIHLYPKAGAAKFPGLIGVNSSFRRDRLLEIGGFDEFFAYYLDETDVCLRLIDRGYKIKVIPDAYVHHKGAPSVVRNYFMFGRSLTYYSYVSNPTLPESEIMAGIQRGLDQFRGMINGAKQHNLITDEQHRGMLGQLEQGHEDGLRSAKSGKPRKFIDLPVPPAGTERFLPYPTIKNAASKLVVCLLSVQYPPGPVGGIARWTTEMGTGLAALGQDIHVITRTDKAPSVNFEDGVWVHRIQAPQASSASPIPVPPWIWNWSKAAHQEVLRINSHHKVDLVVAPIYDLEGLACSLDPSLKTVTTLQTTFKTMTESHPEWRNDPRFWNGVVLPMIDGERYVLERSPHIYSISHAITEMANSSYGIKLQQGAAEMIPIGISDKRSAYQAYRKDKDLWILFVGRLEPRKGTDVLLTAIPELAKQHSNIRFILAGDDGHKLASEMSYKDDFLARFGKESWINQIIFTGRVDDQMLYQLYAECDIFVAPSRFESFGIILLEAMMFGKPVVGCRTGGMQEIVRPEKTGLLAEPGDPASLAKALERLITDPNFRNACGLESRKVFEQEYTSSVMCKRLEAWFRKISGKNSGNADLKIRMLLQ